MKRLQEENNEVHMHNFSSMNGRYRTESELSQVKEERKSLIVTKINERVVDIIKNTGYSLKEFTRSHWFRRYNFRQEFCKDFQAGILLGVLLIPQGLSYGILADLPAHYGLYACLSAPIIYAIFGTSNELCIGPFALISILVSNSVPKDEDYISSVLTVNFLVGLILLLFSLLQLGQIVHFLSLPVTSAFTLAGSTLIATSQVKYLFGISVSSTKSFFGTWLEIFSTLPETNWVTLVLGVSCIIVEVCIDLANENIPILKKKSIKLPGSLVSIIYAVALVALFDLDSKMQVEVLGRIPSNLPTPKLPKSFNKFSELVSSAFMIALVGFSLSYTTSKTLMEKTSREGYKLNPNRELFAHGVANLVGSIFLSYPCFGSLSRSALALNYEVQSPMHNFVSAIFIALFLGFLTNTGILDRLPFCALSAVILFSLRKILLQIWELPKLFRTNQAAFFVWSVTFLGVLALNIAIGLAVGVTFSFLLLLRSISHPPCAVLGRLNVDEGFYRDIKRFPQAAQFEGIIIFRFDSSLHFANISFFTSKLQKLVHKHHPKFIVLDSGSIVNIDYSALVGLEKLVKEFQKESVELIICRAKWRLRDVLDKSGLKLKRFIYINDAISFLQQLHDNNTLSTILEGTSDESESKVQLA